MSAEKVAALEALLGRVQERRKEPGARLRLAFDATAAEPSAAPDRPVAATSAVARSGLQSENAGARPKLRLSAQLPSKPQLTETSRPALGSSSRASDAASWRRISASSVQPRSQPRLSSATHAAPPGARQLGVPKPSLANMSWLA